MEAKIFYRVGHKGNQQGLWYSPNGKHKGLIHSVYNFCTNSHLPMPFDPDLVGWLSATPSLEELYQWFPLEDIERLEVYGYSIMKYEATDYKEYDNHYKHAVISQESSVLIELLPLEKQP